MFRQTQWERIVYSFPYTDADLLILLIPYLLFNSQRYGFLAHLEGNDKAIQYHDKG